MITPLQEQTSICSDPNATVCDADIQYLAEAFGALADPTRLRIVHMLMTRGEMCVCEFMPALDLTQSNVSFHLKTLKHVGLIASRKEGRWMLYRLNREALERFRAEFASTFDLSLWPDEADPISRTDSIRRRVACIQEQNSPLRRTSAGPKGNNNATE